VQARQHGALRAAELEDHEAAPRGEHAEDLRQAGPQVGQVAHAEADRDGIERAIREGEPESVPFDRHAPVGQALPVELLPGDGEHGPGEIAADDEGGGFRLRGESHAQIPGAPAQVQDAQPGVDTRLAGRLAAPAGVEVEAQNVIQEVVPAGNAGEHRFDFRGLAAVQRDRHAGEYNNHATPERPGSPSLDSPFDALI
jgi:hypothetical protein